MEILTFPRKKGFATWILGFPMELFLASESSESLVTGMRACFRHPTNRWVINTKISPNLWAFKECWTAANSRIKGIDITDVNSSGSSEIIPIGMIRCHGQLDIIIQAKEGTGDREPHPFIKEILKENPFRKGKTEMEGMYRNKIPILAITDDASFYTVGEAVIAISEMAKSLGWKTYPPSVPLPEFKNDYKPKVYRYE